MKLVEKMTEPPGHCLVCGRGNRVDEHDQPVPSVDLELQMSWSTAAYLCERCATTVGGLVGLVAPDDVQDAEREVKRLKADLHEMSARLDAAHRREVVIS